MKMVFTRDNIVWSMMLLASAGAYLASHTSLVPPAYAEHVKDIAAFLGFIAGKVSSSPFPSQTTVAINENAGV